MKVEKQPTPEKNFEPFILKISVENKEEAQALYSIFNYSRNSRLLPVQSKMITDAIGLNFYVNNAYQEISNGISYEDFYIKS